MKDEICSFDWAPNNQILCFYSNPRAINLWTPKCLIPININLYKKHIMETGINEIIDNDLINATIKMKWVSCDRILISYKVKECYDLKIV